MHNTLRCAAALTHGPARMQGHALSCCSCDHVTPVLVDRCTPSLLAPVDHSHLAPRITRQAPQAWPPTRVRTYLLPAVLHCARPSGCFSCPADWWGAQQGRDQCSSGCGAELDCVRRPRPPPAAVRRSLNAAPPVRLLACRRSPPAAHLAGLPARPSTGNLAREPPSDPVWLHLQPRPRGSPPQPSRHWQPRRI